MLEELEAFGRRVARVPYEGYSRFLLDEPRPYGTDEAMDRVAEGWGLVCSEKTRVVSRYLDDRGVENSVVGAGFAHFEQNQNILKMGGDASEPPNEEYISQFYDDSREIHCLETPNHLGHWANWFRLDDEEYLMDCAGAEVAPFRLFSGEDVRKLLEARPKYYLRFRPSGLRMYYHRLSPDLLKQIRRTESDQPEYVLGRILSTAVFASSAGMVNLKVWWSRKALDRFLDRQPARVEEQSGGEAEMSVCSTLDEVREKLPEIPEPLSWRSLERAWPEMQDWLDRIFGSPEFVRFLVTRSDRPFSEYSPNRVLEP